jgi:hypothetical protein
MPGSNPAAHAWRRRILVSSLGVLLVIVCTWPLAPQLDRIGRVDSHDGLYGLWQATWVAHALTTHPIDVYDANIFYPHRSTLAFSEPSLLAGVLGLPAFVATQNPYATHNLAVLGFFFLSFLSAYGLGRFLTGDTTASIALAVAYAFCPYVFARTAQLPMLAIFGLPLSLLAMHRLAANPSLRSAAGLAGALWLQALACGYYTVFALLVIGAGLLYSSAFGARWKSGRYWAWTAVAAAMTVALVLPLFLPHLRLARSEGFSRPVEEAYQFAADWRAWFASSAWAHRWMLSMLGSWKEVLFPGFLVTALGVTGAWLGLRGRLTIDPPSSNGFPPIGSRAIVGFYVLLVVLAGWSAFGPAGGLYTVLYHTLPLFAFIRAAGRFGIVVTLALGALMALALAHVGRRGPTGRTVSVAVTVTIFAELFSAPRPMSPALPIGHVYRTLARQAPGPVIEFPMFPRQLEMNSRYVFLSTAHWLPIVNGYGAFWPRDIQQLARDTQTFPSVAALEHVRAWGVRYVVVHPRAYEQLGFASAAAIVSELERLDASMTLIASDGDGRLYELKNWTPR